MAKKRKGVRSPSKFTSLEKLNQLKRDNFFNPETGLELSEGETNELINEKLQSKADKALNKHIRALNSMNKKTKSGNKMLSDSQIERWVTIKRKGRVYRFPIKKGKEEPFL